MAGSATFVCVDMFVLLSGWYGINTKFQKIKAFIFQVLFYSVILYAIIIAVQPEVHFSLNFLIHLFIMDDYWFVPVYLMLYLTAPALNPFIRNTSFRQFTILLIAVITMQSVFGWLNPRESGYMEGCSPISFIILYLIGAYLHRFSDRLFIKRKSLLIGTYFILITFNWILAILAKNIQNEYLLGLSWKFSSPIVIAAAACLLLTFSKLNIGYNKTVNWIAASSFAAFLIHCFPYFYNYVYRPMIIFLFTEYPLWLSIPFIILFVLLLYFASILIDKIRIKIFQLSSSIL